MAILFTCPHCGNQASTTDDLAGQTVPCAGCGQAVTIPALSPAPAEDAVEATSAPRPRAASDNPYIAPVEGPAEPPSGRGCGCGTITVLVLAGLLLLGLLLPAVRSSGEAARRTQCRNNLKNIALGLQNYHDTYKTFPMGAMHAGPAGGSARIGPSWWFGILPYCEQRNIYAKIETLQQPGAPGNGAFNAQNVNAHIPGSPLNSLVPDFLRCPSSPLPLMEESTGPIVLPSYAGIAGGCDIAADSPDYQAAGGVPNLIPRSTRNYYNRQKGVGHVPGGIITASGLLPPCEHVGMAGCTDGTSNTMIVGEQSDWLRDVDPSSSAKYHGDPGWDAQGTGPRVASTIAGGGFLSGTAASLPVPSAKARQPAGPPPLYDCYNITTVRYPPHFKGVLGASARPGCSEDHGINNPLQSRHPGGLQVAMADGSVQFVSQTTELAVLLRLAIRDDGQTVKLNGPASAGSSVPSRPRGYAEMPASKPADRPDHGVGPGLGGDKYAPIEENPFQEVKQEPLSTFSIDVDTASYSKVRMYLMQAGRIALDHFLPGGVNRVILCTDGDFNVGVTGTDELVQIVKQNAKAGVFLSVLGFGMGNHNDAMLEQISNKGNGNYAFIDTAAEARKVLVEQMTGTLITIAKDVKIQVEFNPQQVAAYRLIGYEDRLLAAQDFNDDKKDAGEIGAGHTVTALYEIVPAGVAGTVTVSPVDDLRYQSQGQPNEAAHSGEWLTLKIRFKQPDGDTSSKLEFPLRDAGPRFSQASRDFRFAAAVAAFGMLLRDSQFKGNATYAGVLEIAREAANGDVTGYRDEFLEIIAKAKQLSSG